ncbi:MAG: hypothetical protein QOG62_323 [Thermoleophilaceae bacterium]|nr:hypothetical protein [Thermoleophilaceae bacterium]
MRGTSLALCALSIFLGASSVAVAATPGPYENRGSQYRNVLPPGSNGHADITQLGAFLSTGARPPHNDDQLPLYAGILGGAPGLSRGDLGKYYKDESYGVRPGDVARTYRPRSDVVIVRDKSYGVPHIYGDTRAGTMFGSGYAAAEDRLFFMDVLRHAGRVELSAFAGAAAGNRSMDQDVWNSSPYAEAELQHQYDLADEVYGRTGRQLQLDVQNYVAGINEYIDEAKLNPLLMPGEYPAILKPLGPDRWKVTDVIATAALVAGIFGKGGGSEVTSAMVLDDARDRFGKKKGEQVWEDFRSAEDPEADMTVHPDEGKFEYQNPKGTDARSRALPDAGSLRPQSVVAAKSGGAAAKASTAGSPLAPALDLPGSLDGLLGLPKAASNALLVSAKESKSGHPLAVFGPQVSYFAPEILVEQDIHAPKTDQGPALSARGVAFPGTNLFVQLGRGDGYSWSATSAGQDIIDTFAVDLCEPGGGKPTLQSLHYMYRGQCLPMDVLERTNSWSPTAADATPAGTQTLRAYRTRLGLVAARAKVDGHPVAYTRLRSTYFHEVDSAIGFSEFNDPNFVNSAKDFQRAAADVDYTFNWFYADDKDIAYFNSGDNPVRAKGADPSLPVHGTKRWEWRGYNPSYDRSRGVPFSEKQAPAKEHPQVINQDFLTSWNNKQAKGYRAADGNYGYSSVYRSQSLTDRVKAGIRGKRKMTLPGLADAMEDAATVDLRGSQVLPHALRVLGRQSGARGKAVRELRDWYQTGAHRIDRNGDGLYEHRAAVMLMDAWWPLLIKAEFKPTLGQTLYDQIQAMLGLDNAPNNHGAHMGSAYQDGWYGYASKDLRTVAGQKVRGRYSRVYCGGGNKGRCRSALERSLDKAIKVARNPHALYNDDACKDAGRNDTVECYDAIQFRATGGVTQPLIPWQNRPTFQQAIEIKK